MKIALVCSRGGHVVEMLQLIDAFAGYDYFFVTDFGPQKEVLQKLSLTYFMNRIGMNFFRMMGGFIWAYKIIICEKPDVIISTGAEIGLPFIFWGWLFKKHTIFIESWARVNDLSLTGKLVYPVVDEFWVQWPQLQSAIGKKSKYHGSIV
jgi:beta-1,4-N-acetylglucosaminyltransferase